MAATKMPRQLRQLFEVMLLTCHMAEPVKLWNKYQDSLAEDILHQLQQQNPNDIITYSDAIYNRALVLLESHV